MPGTVSEKTHKLSKNLLTSTVKKDSQENIVNIK